MYYNAGLILEGGGMRGVYTAGVLDGLMDHDIDFMSIYGVSAGACHAASYMSKQRGRAFRVNVNYLNDPRYLSAKSYLKTGDLFGADMLYSQIPNVYDPFDYPAFDRYAGCLYATVTNLETGRAEYLRVTDLRKHMWKIRASASLPIISRTIAVHGKYYLDGGVGDSIPIKKSEADGNVKNVIVLTRDRDYRKEPNKMMPLIKLRYHKYKEFIKRIEDRHIRYNEVVEYIEAEEKAGKVFVIRPQAEVEVGRLEKNREKLTALYEQGIIDVNQCVNELLAYLQK